jgi:hypothetical protein
MTDQDAENLKALLNQLAAELKRVGPERTMDAELVETVATRAIEDPLRNILIGKQ